MDYDRPFASHRFSLRLFQADYRWMHVNYGLPALTAPTNGALGGRTNLNGIDLSTGIVTHFGHIIPPPPVTYSCSASPTTVFPGDPITVTGTALNINPKKVATYSWTADGGTISGTSSTATIDTKTANPGSYTAKGHVSEGAKPGEMADCSATYTVKPFEPPTISCSANPTTLNPGDSSTITATGVSPQNRPLTYSYSASSGSITGNTSSATLSTAGAAPGTITVTANVVDDKGQTASCTTSVSVTAPPPPPAPTTSALCSMNFERDKRRPGRVDNEAKACLDDISLSLQQRSDAKIILVGSSNAAEKEAAAKAAARKTKKPQPPVDLAAQRAVNAMRLPGHREGHRCLPYIGLHQRDGWADGNHNPGASAGATADTSGDTAVDESAVKAVPRTPPAKTKKK